MSYPKSFWQPKEEAYGSLWRDFYNKYLKADTILAGAEMMLRDFYPTIEEAHRPDLAALRVGHALFFENGRETVARLERILRESKVPDSDWEQEVLAQHRRVILDNACSGILDHGLVGFDYEGIDGLFDQEPSICPQDELKIARDHWEDDWGKSRRYRQLFNHVFNLSRGLFDFRSLKSIVEKTWRGQGGFGSWTAIELLFLDTVYSVGVPYLGVTSEWDLDDQATIDPAEVEVRYPETQVPRFGPGHKLTEVFDRLLFMCVCDFVDELIQFNRHNSIKGSAQCHECGSYYPRSFYGHGQKYCSTQCKSRAAKTRQRAKRANAAYRQRSLK